MAVIRPNGYPMLVTPGSRVYDLADGSVFIDTLFSGLLRLAKSPDQTLIANESGVAASVLRTALDGVFLVIKRGVVSPGTAQGAPGESCFSSAGDRIYTASGAPYDFPATSISTKQIIQRLPGNAYPDSIQCVWNGLVIGGINGYGLTNDISAWAPMPGTTGPSSGCGRDPSQ